MLHHSDHNDAVPEKNHRSTDSDNEEFCDSMEHLAMEVWCPSPKVYTYTTLKKHFRKTNKVKHKLDVFSIQTVVDPLLFLSKGRSTLKRLSPASVRQKDLWFESNTTLIGGEDQVLMGDSYFREGISTSQHNSSLSRRGRGEAAVFD